MNIQISDYLLIFAVIIGGILLQLLFAVLLTEYKRESKYIKIEIKRSSGRELIYWKKQKRTLWLRILLNLFR